MFGRRRRVRVEVWVGDGVVVSGWAKRPLTPEQESSLVALAAAALESYNDPARGRRRGAPRKSG